MAKMGTAIQSLIAIKPKPDRFGVVAIVQDQVTLDRIREVVRELQLDDELSFVATLDVAIRHIHDGQRPRVLIIDISDSRAPIADLSAARAVGGADLKVVALGSVNDVELYRNLIAAGATDYLIKPPSHEALSTLFERHSFGAGGASGLGRVVAFIGSRGGVGCTTAAVSCAWVLAKELKERTALVDLDLQFGTVALQLDIEPGNGLCEAFEQPSRIDSLFIERAMIRAAENLRVLAAEAAIVAPEYTDAGADMLLYELRRKFSRIVVDLPRSATPVQRVVLSAASHIIVLCELSLAGLRDTIRLKDLIRVRAPQAQLLLVETGAHARIGKSQFEKAAGAPFDDSLSYDTETVDAAVNTGEPPPLTAPHSSYTRDIQRLIIKITGATEPHQRRLFGFNIPW
jgi:pilus assembly protein CpaE